MEKIDKKPKTHAFVCTNQREEGKSCCAAVGGKDLFHTLKNWVRQDGHLSRIQVSQSGCLGYCNSVGPTLFIYREHASSEAWHKITPKAHEELKNKLLHLSEG